MAIVVLWRGMESAVADRVSFDRQNWSFRRLAAMTVVTPPPILARHHARLVMMRGAFAKRRAIHAPEKDVLGVGELFAIHHAAISIRVRVSPS